MVEASFMSEATKIEEEYLESIFRLEEKYSVAKTGDIAKSLNVALGTVTNTIERLEQQSFLSHKPYKGVKLTEKGRKIAVTIIRKHRLSERMLTDLLKMDWSKVHDSACLLEHALTDDVIKLLDKTLGYPKTCPHGRPIPTKSGKIIEDDSQPLEKLPEGGKGVVLKVVNEDKDYLSYLSSINIIPGTLLEILKKGPFEEPITVKIKGKKNPLSRKLASTIHVVKVSG